jgi:hypothetical protein
LPEAAAGKFALIFVLRIIHRLQGAAGRLQHRRVPHQKGDQLGAIFGGLNICENNQMAQIKTITEALATLILQGNVPSEAVASAEFGFAVLSFGGSRLIDPQALRLIAWSCIAFHTSSGVLELYAYAQGTNVLVLGNVVARIIIVALFACLSRRGLTQVSG